MSSVDRVFQSLRSVRRKALIPFITAGDPNLAVSAQLVRELAARECSICELGVPYSDPIADGPVIQESYTRALDRKTRVDQIFDMAAGVSSGIQMPLITMVSYAIIYRYGLQRYIADALEAGIAGAIVPDLPVEEAEQFSKLCRDEDFSLIQLVTPTTPRDRAVRIANSSTGFLYYVSVTGITGERTELPPDLLDNVGWLRDQTELPICIGFGISSPQHVRRLAPVADGLIVGSAIVRRIAGARGTTDDVCTDVGNYVQELLGALNESCD